MIRKSALILAGLLCVGTAFADHQSNVAINGQVLSQQQLQALESELQDLYQRWEELEDEQA